MTDKETIEIAQMVLGKVNKDLVANDPDSGCAGCRDQRHGWRYAEGRKEVCRMVVDIGYVGDIKSKWIRRSCMTFMEQDFLPDRVSLIGMDDNGDAYNINADEAASCHRDSTESGEAGISFGRGRCAAGSGRSIIRDIRALCTNEAEKLVEQKA